MGSIGQARITGFLCRLCTAISPVVIHIYGDHGRRINLEEKITKYMPIFVSPTDALPKTICLKCLECVERNYGLEKCLNILNKLLKRMSVSPMGNSDESSDSDLDADSGEDSDADEDSDLDADSDEDGDSDEETK